MKTSIRAIPLILGLAFAIPSSFAAGEQRYTGVVEHILAAWKTADCVCLGEDHGRQYDSDLRIALVRHPAFPYTVRVIVVEMANPIHQDLLDRFILRGDNMTRLELAPIWRDANGAEVWESPIYEQFLRAVREVNLELPRSERVRVLGGDSKIDWPAITRSEQLVPLVNRGANIRKIIAEEILEPHLKGLAIYGAGHCGRVGGGFPGDLAGKYAESRFWSIWPLFRDKAAQKARETLGLGAQPAYVLVKGTKLASQSAAELLGDQKSALGDLADALIYHGEVSDSVVPADLAELNTKYAAEFERRRQLISEALKLFLKQH